MKWLFDILKDGTLRDNQVYHAADGYLSNFRFSKPIHLNQRQGKQWHNIQNNEAAIWKFLSTVASELNKDLFENLSNSAIFFNEGLYEHNTDNAFINLTGSDARNFTLKTGNLIGSVKRGDYTLKISSRFGDKFLKYIIADADGFLELENYGGEQEDSGYEWLLIYLWKIKLKKAYRLGLPKAYISRGGRLNKVRGIIDPVAYFQDRKDGKYQCSYREHSYNNAANRLIAAAFNKVKDNTFLHDMHMVRNAFITATEGQRANRMALKNTPYFSNPFYSEYNPVIDLSKRIIRDELADFGEQSDISAFFFDISMLFEYFVRKLLSRAGITVNSKYNTRYEIPTGGLRASRKLEPDIVFEHESKTYVFDVKYKYYDFHYGVKREDLFQLHTYTGQYGNNMEIGGAGFIYPISEEKWVSQGKGRKEIGIHSVFEQNGRRIPFHVLFIKVPGGEENFTRKFRNNCKDFTDSFTRNVIPQT